MGNKDEKSLERLVDSVMQDAKLQSPPLDFTDKVLERIEKMEATTTTLRHRPLIPKYALALIFGALLLATIYLAKTADFSETNWLQSLGLLENRPQINWPNFSIPFSRIWVYISLAFGGMMAVQTVWIKNYLNRPFT